MADLDKKGAMSGMTEGEAREFHGVFTSSFVLFTIIAIVAHILAWMWRPWAPGPKGYSSLIEDVDQTVAALTTFFV